MVFIAQTLRRWNGDNRACVSVCFLSKPSPYLHSSEGEEVTLHDLRRGREKVRSFPYTPPCIQYYDMAVDDIRQSAVVVMMTGSTLRDSHNVTAYMPLPLALALSASGARLNTR
jgi:hypothetical protein